MVAINQKIRRLPGFRFEAQAASRARVLPRMDIALFIGFASSGPIGIPVVLESAEQFNTIFGRDLPLVWNKEKGETVHAYLAPSVRAFFRNGGSRCWVIRTARTKPSEEKPLNRACRNFFPLAGLAGAHFNAQKIADIVPAFARARAKGSWSDDLQTGTAILARPVKFRRLDKTAGAAPPVEQKILYLDVSVKEPLKTGELLRLDFADKGLILFLTADKIEDGAKDFSPPTPAPVGKLIVKITSERFVWLRKLSASDAPGQAQNVSVRLWTNQINLNSEDFSRMFLDARQADLSFEMPENEGVEASPPQIRLRFADLTTAGAPPAGSLLVTEFQNEQLCLQVETVNPGDSKTSAGVELSCRAMFCLKNVKQPDSVPNVERLAFELWIKRDKKSFLKLSDLAFNSNHERFWGNLPTDEQRHRFSEDKAEAPAIPAWTQTGDSAIFPLAGNGDREAFYFPVFPTPFPENYLGGARLQGIKLQRDGLEEFDAGLFLDEKLKNTGLNNLLSEAEFIRYLSPRPRALWGIHSALAPETTIHAAVDGSPTNPTYTSLSLEEATIISVPDALHRGWFQQTDDGQMILSPPPPSPPPLRPEWWTFQDCRKPDARRVRQPLWENFLDCGIQVVEIPQNLQVPEEAISNGGFTLIWKYAEPDETASSETETDKSLRFVLEESATPNFQFPQVIYRGKQKNLAIARRGAGVYYYRVRAEINLQVSDWSDGVAVRIPAAERWVTNAPHKYQPNVLFAVQRALLRMCAARGDLFAVLSLPEHYDKDDAVTHIAALKAAKGLTAGGSETEPFSADEARALSFGAVYHPWLTTREDGFETARNVPACGAVCGVMARRSAQRGAWIAPANEPLQNVFGLATSFGRESFPEFQDNLINLVRQEPTGFLVLDSDTLSDDADLRPINVRRLLSLLRRLALKHGAEYVFEPNDERFRRQVQRGFTSLLDLMFARGAFAGATPATSYQVAVSESVNNFQSVEQGRFIVELRVAPSLPLKFVTVRLVQTGGRSSVSETV
jgi:hypothetical protein